MGKRRIAPRGGFNVGFKPLKTYEGETIENKVKRMVENNEPITDGAPIVYTEKKDGVKPEYNIRTDKWDVALNAMDAVNRAKIAKGNASGISGKPEDHKNTDGDGQETETTDTGGE